MKELKWLAGASWENIWGRNWGLCLAKLIGRTKAFKKISADDSLEGYEWGGLVDEDNYVEFESSML